jgi:hypothetical protein
MYRDCNLNAKHTIRAVKTGSNMVLGDVLFHGGFYYLIDEAGNMCFNAVIIERKLNECHNYNSPPAATPFVCCSRQSFPTLRDLDQHS